MATPPEIQAAARKALGHPLPASVQIINRGRDTLLIGPPATGKTRTAVAYLRALTPEQRRKTKIFTGLTLHNLEREFA